MFMVPLPFVIAIFSALFLVYELLNRGLERRNGWFISFLALLTFQEVLVGLRFGYGIDTLRLIQPLTASLLPPLAYLSFKRPAFDRSAAIHLVPLVAVTGALALWVDGLDTLLAMTNLFYAVALIRLGLGGSDALGWVEVHLSKAVLVLLWLVVVIQLTMVLTDAVIAYDFWVSDGSNTGRIVGWTTLLGMTTFALGYVAAVLIAKRNPKSDASNAADNEQVFSRLSELMQTEKLHLDADINLNRIARRMVRPARDVSRAVNAVAGCNVSQYINRLRVQEACRLLAGSDMSVTQVIYAAGFNTKSNFNREFTRNTGQTPSAWRAARVAPLDGG